MKQTILWIVLVLIGIPLNISADTIYTWKDKNGVSKFSNAPPPEYVTEYETIDSAATEANKAQPDNQRRSSYDQMVKRATQESEASSKQRKKEAAAKAEEQKRIEEARQKALRQAERRRLESEIAAIKKRAVSRTYPNGMKQAQIDALVKQIENLEKGSDTTIEQKKEAAPAETKQGSRY